MKNKERDLTIRLDALIACYGSALMVNNDAIQKVEYRKADTTEYVYIETIFGNSSLIDVTNIKDAMAIMLKISRVSYDLLDLALTERKTILERK